MLAKFVTWTQWVQTGGRKFYAVMYFGTGYLLAIFVGLAFMAIFPDATDKIVELLKDVGTTVIGLILAYSGSTAYVEGKHGGARVIEELTNRAKDGTVQTARTETTVPATQPAPVAPAPAPAEPRHSGTMVEPPRED